MLRLRGCTHGSTGCGCIRCGARRHARRRCDVGRVGRGGIEVGESHGYTRRRHRSSTTDGTTSDATDAHARWCTRRVGVHGESSRRVASVESVVCDVVGVHSAMKRRASAHCSRSDRRPRTHAMRREEEARLIRIACRVCAVRVVCRWSSPAHWRRVELASLFRWHVRACKSLLRRWQRGTRTQAQLALHAHRRGADEHEHVTDGQPMSRQTESRGRSTVQQHGTATRTRAESHWIVWHHAHALRRVVRIHQCSSSSLATSSSCVPRLRSRSPVPPRLRAVVSR